MLRCNTLDYQLMPATVSIPLSTPSINVHLMVPTMDTQLCNANEAPYNVKLADYILRLSTSQPSPGTGPVASILIGIDYQGTLPVQDGAEDNPERILQALKCNPLTIAGQSSEDGKCAPSRQVRLQLTPFYSLPPIPSDSGDTDAPRSSCCGSCISSHITASTDSVPVTSSSSSSSSGGASNRLEVALSSSLPAPTSKISSTEEERPGGCCRCPPNQSLNQGIGVAPEAEPSHSGGNTASEGRRTCHRPRQAGRRPSLPLMSNAGGHLPLEYEALMEADMDDLLAHDLIHWTPEQLVEDALERALKSAKVKITSGQSRARSKAAVVPQAPGGEPLAAARNVEAGEASIDRKPRKHKRSMFERLAWGLFGACSGCSVNAL
ncbi:hypothetical protein Vretimale_16319 [Volvox reticuliferus]|uniref:Uncharacterized protein n=1 Tax=Volvox reticuliferus TaxID=1737510 RepID=A0A8J4D224_9CHLO|nr:hypothetical protein Vretifemale_17919 [Volvox reticuliferus]GIM13171.1 hypothetical protein Vretimale_16319 [Volvox reticuliferus]